MTYTTFKRGGHARSRRAFLEASAAITAAAVGYRTTSAEATQGQASGVALPSFRDLFNGRDFTGWRPMANDDHTWSVRDGMIVCSGHPNGILRSDRQYENFVAQLDWMHMEPGGNSGFYIWTDSPPDDGKLPKAIEIQILELDWVKLNTKEGSPPPPIAYVHGELIPVNGFKFVADTPRGNRSMSIENRAKGRGEWNTYTVVAIDGVVKLAVNGKFVNGVSQSSQKKGYIGLQSEGAEIHFRNLKIMELPPGVTTAQQTAPE
jgi:hypothetical protein